MRPGICKILVTGGAGFIGSEFVRQLINRDCPRQSYSVAFKRGLSLKKRIIVVDKLTYAGDLDRLREVRNKIKFYKTDICNLKQMRQIFAKEKPDIVVNFAAQTHVDRSIIDSGPFLGTNVQGTKVLLDVSRKFKIAKFIQISSDEVYGEIEKGSFDENAPLRPNSPYAASKAAGDLLIRSYIRTYGFPAIIIRPSNNFGPWQYPEKLIPLAVLKILRSENVPVYGDGKHVREWLFVEDCVRGILQVLEKGRSGEIYNLGSQDERENIEVVKMVLKVLKKDNKLIEFVKDRPGHDIRYSLNSGKLFTETGWKPKIKFNEGIKLTLDWCLRHKDWLLSKWKNIAKLYN